CGLRPDRDRRHAERAQPCRLDPAYAARREGGRRGALGAGRHNPPFVNRSSLGWLLVRTDRYPAHGHSRSAEAWRGSVDPAYLLAVLFRLVALCGGGLRFAPSLRQRLLIQPAIGASLPVLSDPTPVLGLVVVPGGLTLRQSKRPPARRVRLNGG